MSWKRSFVFGVAMVLGAAFAVQSAETTYADGPKHESVRGKFGHRTFKGRSVVTAVYDSGLQGLVISAVKIAGIKQTTILLEASSVADLATSSFPVTFTGAAGQFSIISPRGGKAWGSVGTMTITLTGYDPTTTRLTGTYEGTMEPADTSPGGTLSVTKGKFAADVLVQ